MDNTHILPVEIYEKIFNYIKNTKTILNIRLSCKLFYLLNKDIEIYENNILLYTYKFNRNFIRQNLLNIYNKNNKIIGYIDFDIDGYTKVIDDLKINVHNNIVFYRNYNYNYYISRIYNIVTKKTQENIINSICNIS